MDLVLWLVSVITPQSSLKLRSCQKGQVEGMEDSMMNYMLEVLISFLSVRRTLGDERRLMGGPPVLIWMLHTWLERRGGGEQQQRPSSRRRSTASLLHDGGSGIGFLCGTKRRHISFFPFSPVVKYNLGPPHALQP